MNKQTERLGRPASSSYLRLLPIWLGIGYNIAKSDVKEDLLLEMRGLMGGFYRIAEWIMRLSAINVLWIICSLPFFFIVLVGMMMPDATTDEMIQNLWMMALISPFTLFPASAAMFAVARKWVMGDVDVPLFKTYFRSYKENYKQSMLGGLILLFMGVVLIISIRFYAQQPGILGWLSFLFISLGVVFIAAVINFFSIMVHLEMKLFQLIKNSIIITLGQPFSAVSMLVINGVILYFSLFRFTFLVPFFMGSLCAFASFWFFHKSFERIQDKAEKARLAEEEAEDVINELNDGSVKPK